MDPLGCKQGFVTDLTLISTKQITGIALENTCFDTFDEAFEFFLSNGLIHNSSISEDGKNVNGQVCGTSFVPEAVFASIVALLRLLLLILNVFVFISLQKRRSKMSSKASSKSVQQKSGSSANARRVPFTFLLEASSTGFLTLFTVLSLTNVIGSQNGTGLILYALVFIPYNIGTILSIVKMIHLSKRVILKTISAPKSDKKGNSSPGTAMSNIDGTLSNSTSGMSKNQQQQQPDIVSSLATLGSIKSSSIMKYIFGLAVASALAPILFLVVALAIDFDPSISVWTSAFFYCLGVSSVSLVCLVMIHTYRTIHVVKTSSAYQATKKKQVLGTTNSNVVVAKITRLINRLWIRFFVNLVGGLSIPPIMFLQGAGIVSIGLSTALIHAFVLSIASLAALMIYKPPGCMNCCRSLMPQRSRFDGSRDNTNNDSSTKKSSNNKPGIGTLEPSVAIQSAAPTDTMGIESEYSLAVEKEVETQQ